MAFITFSLDYTETTYKPYYSNAVLQTSSISWDLVSNTEFRSLPQIYWIWICLFSKILRWFVYMLGVWEAEVENGCAMALVSGRRRGVIRGHWPCRETTPALLGHHPSFSYQEYGDWINGQCLLSYWGDIWDGFWIMSEVATSCLFFTWQCIYSILVSQFIPLSPSPLCPHVHSIHPHLCFCPADRFICTIFLDSTYMH